MLQALGEGVARPPPRVLLQCGDSGRQWRTRHRPCLELRTCWSCEGASGQGGRGREDVELHRGGGRSEVRQFHRRSALRSHGREADGGDLDGQVRPGGRGRASGAYQGHQHPHVQDVRESHSGEENGVALGGAKRVARRHLEGRAGREHRPSEGPAASLRVHLVRPGKRGAGQRPLVQDGTCHSQRRRTAGALGRVRRGLEESGIHGARRRSPLQARLRGDALRSWPDREHHHRHLDRNVRARGSQRHFGEQVRGHCVEGVRICRQRLESSSFLAILPASITKLTIQGRRNVGHFAALLLLKFF